LSGPVFRSRLLRNRSAFRFRRIDYLLAVKASTSRPAFSAPIRGVYRSGRMGSVLGYLRTLHDLLWGGLGVESGGLDGGVHSITAPPGGEEK